ncbi:hypothetical protein [Halomicrobium salinisoli]|uniref:hypothetical protein n=1 Tax=Halomicrobium salinisoli TaxID=2878391 RepID=UPI001CF05AD7|nr:hypothetical protein [Halomicrobium salinisoli]
MRILDVKIRDILTLILILASSAATLWIGPYGLLVTIILVTWRFIRFREKERRIQEIEEEMGHKRDEREPIVENASL